MEKLLLREALDYGLLCSLTGFVAARQEHGKPVERTSLVGSALPDGWADDFAPPPPSRRAYFQMAASSPDLASGGALYEQPAHPRDISLGEYPDEDSGGREFPPEASDLIPETQTQSLGRHSPSSGRARICGAADLCPREARAALWPSTPIRRWGGDALRHRSCRGCGQATQRSVLLLPHRALPEREPEAGGDRSWPHTAGVRRRYGRCSGMGSLGRSGSARWKAPAEFCEGGW